MEKVDKKSVVKNGFKCPRCAFDFKEGDEFSTDDFDDLMMTDFAADGDRRKFGKHWPAVKRFSGRSRGRALPRCRRKHTDKYGAWEGGTEMRMSG
jgi:hypothetical protein